MAKKTMSFQTETRPKVCKCCGQYINPPRRRARSNNRPADRFLPEGVPSNEISELHWEVVGSEVSLKDAYRQLVEDESLQGDHFGRLWDSSTYFLYTTERQNTEAEAIEKMLRCNLNSRAIKPFSIGCLIINDTEYLFFWSVGEHHAGI